LYGTVDIASGHFRRYTLQGLEARAQKAGFEVVVLRYMNLAGVLPYWLKSRVLHRKASFSRTFQPWQLTCIRKLIPFLRVVDSMSGPPMGQSAILVARRPPNIMLSSQEDPDSFIRITHGQQQRDRNLFDHIADSYSAKDLRPSSRIARQQRVVQTLARVPLSAESDILEVGCGAGFATQFIAGLFRSYRGVDHSEHLISVARRHNSSDNVTFIAGEFCDYQSATLFDVVFMIGVLHHASNPIMMLNNALALLKPGGWIALNEPQPSNPVIHAMRRVRKWTDAKYSKEQTEISRRTVEQHLSAVGFVSVETFAQGLVSTPFAEVIIGPQIVSQYVSRVSCYFDQCAESVMPKMLRGVSWNLVAVGKRPEE
jgi:2-polyprenyl-3-methyl-5-hydroxy-6-metoxy-1,4-benzoquinol methylase